MPVRSSRSPILTWPQADQVAAALHDWGAGLLASRSDVEGVGCFGSYARGDWGVGSDLDVIVVVEASEEPPMRRGLAFDTITDLPVPVDLLVYTRDEWDGLRAQTSGFARRIVAEVVWVARRK